MPPLVLTDIRRVIGVVGVPGVVMGRAPSDLLLIVMLTRATLLSGQWPVDKMRPLMADMQTARLGVDHSDARRRTGRKSLVGCADLE